jgi:amino acid transporter
VAFQASFPQGNLLYSILISGMWVSFLVIAYTGLVVTIPRAGGDYVWQSRILGSGLGFVMAATGWWFIMWLWAPAAVRQDLRLVVLPERQPAVVRRGQGRAADLPLPGDAGQLGGAQRRVPVHPHPDHEPVVLRLGGDAVPVLDPGDLRRRLRPVLPDAATQVSEKRRVPFPSLVLMLLPAVGLGALYAYNTTFAQYTLDGVLVAAVTYLFSVIAVVILPLRKPDLWYASAASKVKVLGVPVVPVAGVITIVLLVYNLYEWLANGTYGVNHKGSLVCMGAMYVLAIVIYGGARIIRNRQGIDLGLINKEIPVE